MNRDYKYNQALRYLDRGQANLAIEQLKELLSEAPDIAEYHGLLALCLLSVRRLYAAEYELSIALGLQANNAYLHYIKAQILYFKNKHQDSLEACNEALSLDPESTEVLRLKSNIYLDRAKCKDALTCLHEAAAIDANSLETFSAYGNFYLKTGDLDKALGYATEALSIAPEDEDANILMAEVCLQNGDMENAEYHAKFAISRNPQSNSALRVFANIKMKKNFFLGLWWHYNSKISLMSRAMQVTVLVSAYLLFNLFSQIFADLGYPGTSNTLTYSWLALVLYSWIGIPLYYRSLRKEIESFSFRKDY